MLRAPLVLVLGLSLAVASAEAKGKDQEKKGGEQAFAGTIITSDLRGQPLTGPPRIKTGKGTRMVHIAKITLCEGVPAPNAGPRQNLKPGKAVKVTEKGGVAIKISVD